MKFQLSRAPTRPFRLRAGSIHAHIGGHLPLSALWSIFRTSVRKSTDTRGSSKRCQHNLYQHRSFRRTRSYPMADLHPLSSPLRGGAFVSMQSYRDGVRPGDGGTALAMESFVPTIKRERSGQLKRRQLARSLHSNSNAMKQLVNGSLEPSNELYPSTRCKCVFT